MRLVVEQSAAAQIRRGHPWIYREALILPRGRALETGAAVELVDGGGAPLGWGLYDASSPIAVRVYPTGGARGLDAGALARGIARAVAARDAWFDRERTTALRLCHGEGDRVPGLVLDRYDAVAVLRTDGAAIEARLAELVPHLVKLLEPRGVRTLLHRIPGAQGDGEKVRALWGQAPPETVDVLEHGVVTEVDVLRGQKTGAFLDQRENRRFVRELAPGRRRVLNLFSYAGGFSIAAALGGAEEVTSVDLAAKAHATAQRCFARNGVDPKKHRFVTADATTHVDELARRKERFDLVISDPPSFAKNERSVGRALAAYAKLHRACAALLGPGGVLCAASCSSHVGLDRFLGTLDDAALGRGDLSVREVRGAGPDHPSLAAFPEGRYLKFVVMG